MEINETIIKSTVCESFGIEESDFVIMGRSESFSHPRFAYYVLCRKHTKLTLSEIGKTVMLDHSAVSRGISRHEDLMVTKRDYSFSFKKSENQLKQILEL